MGPPKLTKRKMTTRRARSHGSDATGQKLRRRKNRVIRDKGMLETEVNTLGLIQHVNLVRLVGFCSSGGDEKMLVYEYMPNGSLDSYLFGGSPCPSWHDRYAIMLGFARGLSYLHEGCRERIIHCDIKPENIPLDKDLCPKIADFGMAKLVGRDFSRVLTTMPGTIGYLAPEWISGLPISAKADV
ncbi:hypothetical protein C2845_PM08G14320 [Panicum miliaceum]|uniref:non-specific serine/threonine protein kinase n=1 Tax=Panicum miliaceum TaxID=4540 RepID=A0A3L6R3P7_PANMI|nr:hypothetical protein C2845_PM08G14320 [Panicum miliaceum]